jgi:hypothetical protein
VTPIATMGQALKIFIGWDSREPVAYSVLADSILRRASVPVSITPLSLSSLRRIYTRERGPTESTEFSLTRFLVPYLSGYSGVSLFMDCDMLCQGDVLDLLMYPLADPGKAVYVCQHEYTPRDETKFLGQPQTAYPRKNWSSLMLFENACCKALTPDYVNAATGLELHRFQWLQDDRIGSLPLAWNHLVGEYPPNANAQVLHWTLGGPWFDAYRETDHADLWFSARQQMLGVAAEVAA